MNAKKTWRIIKRAIKEYNHPVSVVDELGRVVRFTTEEKALKHLGTVRIINQKPNEFFWMPQK